MTDLIVEYPGTGRVLHGVSLQVFPSETVALVGASGCGKSTLARCILGLKAPVSGSIQIHGASLLHAKGTQLRSLRRQMQAVFQDPGGSINDRMRVGEVIGEPLEVLEGVRGPALAARVGELLDDVGLDAQDAQRYPHQCSGGQKQRIAIARALSVDPTVLICDEPTSALDVSVQARVLYLLMQLQHDRTMAMLMVTHDLAVAAHTSDRIAVLDQGRIVEDRPTRDVLDDPHHPITKALVEATI